MADRPPPSRYSVVERGGRLVVIDRDTGTTPPSAAERMAEYDRRMGHERARPAVREPSPAPAPVQAEPAVLPTDPIRAAIADAPRDAAAARKRIAGAIGERAKPAPWQDKRPAAAKAQPQAKARPSVSGGERKTIVTGKWWDAKGPRTIDLGPKGQQVLSGGFVTIFFVAVAAAIILLVISPVVLFFVAFLIFRFGGQILGPIGAGIVDKAIAERN